jgi:hypothetical protein
VSHYLLCVVLLLPLVLQGRQRLLLMYSVLLVVLRWRWGCGLHRLHCGGVLLLLPLVLGLSLNVPGCPVVADLIHVGSEVDLQGTRGATKR